MKTKIQHEEEKFKEAATSAARVEEFMLLENKGYLETETDLEKTYKFKQQDIKEHVDSQTSKKAFNIRLKDLGPYKIDYSRTGNHLLICGSKGHIASFNWKQGTLESEIQTGESVRAGKWLQGDNQFYAVAQKKYVYIYDGAGTEVHKLKGHVDVTLLEYLNFHFLLASAGNMGSLKYQDVSTGKLVATLKTRLGPTQSIAQNPYNAVVHLGHANGTVTLWSPSTDEPLVKLLVSKGPVRSIAIDREGKYMACGASDKTVKIWDIRNLKESLNSYYSPTPATSLHISETGLLSVGFSSHIQIWKDPFTRGEKPTSPYMNHTIPSSAISNVRFCPFEDILGVGHSNGISSLIIPGSGEANFDGLEINPYMNASREGRRENEVRELLNKLQPEMIVLDPTEMGTLATMRNQFDKSSDKQITDSSLISSTGEEDDHKGGKTRENILNNNGTNSSSARRGLNSIETRNIKVQKIIKNEERLQKQKKQIEQKLKEEKKKVGSALARFR